MTSTFKPYRLINALELQSLQQDFDNTLQHWNKEHALFPLSCRLDLGPTKPSQIINSHDISTIKHSLFGDESTCFDAIAEDLFTTLLNQLFGTQPKAPVDDWFYPGSPALTLTLSCSDKTMQLYIDPQWVLNALPSHTYRKPSATPLQDALATQQIKLHVELTSLPLSLSEILRLQVGDVIKTDHPITEPAQLVQHDLPICSVDIGKFNSYKSIQIMRTV